MWPFDLRQQQKIYMDNHVLLMTYESLIIGIGSPKFHIMDLQNVINWIQHEVSKSDCIGIREN